MTRNIIFIAILTVLSCQSKGQDPRSEFRQKRIAQITGILSVDSLKAKKVIEALDFNVEKIARTLKDTLNSAAKQKSLKFLIDERQKEIDKVLSANQQRQLAKALESEQVKAKQQREKFVKEQEEKLKKFKKH